MLNALKRGTDPTSDPDFDADRRRHRRVALELAGRFMRQDKSEHPCRLKNISIIAAAFTTEQRLKPSERLIVYVEELGRLEGAVFRTTADGFVIMMEGSQRWRDKLASQLTWLINRDQLSSADQRRPGHERWLLDAMPTTIRLQSGEVIACELLDVSISGASISSSARPAHGSVVSFADIEAEVVRHHEHGFAVQFKRLLEQDELRERFGL